MKCVYSSYTYSTLLFQGHSTNVTAIAFSPWQPDYFLIGCGDGTISLYHHKNEHPLISWTRSTRGRAVEQVLWSSHRPGVFIVLDEASTIHLWWVTVVCVCVCVCLCVCVCVCVCVFVCVSVCLRSSHQPGVFIVLDEASTIHLWYVVAVTFF